MKKEPFYKKLWDHIEEQITFDMQSDTEGYPTIHWIIARSMLSRYTEFERHQLLNSYVTNVKNSLSVALDYGETLGVNAYRSIPKGEKIIRFLTTDCDYLGIAEQHDFDRQKNRIVSGLKSFDKNIRLKFPDKLAIVGSDTKRLTNKLESTL